MANRASRWGRRRAGMAGARAAWRAPAV